MPNNPVPENQKTDADREAERIAAEKKANAEKEKMEREAEDGIDRTTPGLNREPDPLAEKHD